MTQGPDGKPCLVLIVFFNGSEEEGRQNFKKIFDLGPVMDTSKEIPYEQANHMLDAIATPGLNYFMKGVFMSPTPSKDLNSIHMQRIAKYAASGLFKAVSLVLEYIPHEKINSVPSSSTPYPRDLRGNAVIVVQWENDTPEKTKAAREAAHDLAKMLPEGEGYSNYSPDSDTLPKEGRVAPNKTQALFKDNYPRLQKIKREYDPEMVFNKWFAIAPAAA